MNKTAVITGGTKGIGKSLVKVFAKEGFEIVTNSRNTKELLELQKEVESETGNTIHIYQANFEFKEQVLAFGDFIEQTLPQVNVLINNAGIFLPGESTKEEEGVYEKEIAINLSAPYYLVRKLLHLLEKSKDAYIFNMCSTASITSHTNGGSYSISKYGLLGFTKVLRQELKHSKIGVTALMPGATLTNSWAETDLPPERFMKSDDIAQFVLTAWKTRTHTVLEEIVMRPYLGDI
ncbi:MAG: SDR family oxidoreductase [Bacteroidetes bacterium]|nr:SDR family oxidoreductase [Bacteroidota bacterium]